MRKLSFPNARRSGAFLAAIILMMGVLASPSDALRREALKLHTAGGVHTLKIEVAETREEKVRGLMYRKHLPDDAGMLFIFDRPREITMWMRNTYIPLDIVFIRADGRVHRIEARAKPLSETDISSHGNVIACLEMAGGAAHRLRLRPGDRVEHPAFKWRENETGARAAPSAGSSPPYSSPIQ